MSTTERTRRTTRGTSGIVIAMITVPDARAGERDKRDGEEDRRDRHEPVHEAHDDRVDAAEIAGDEPDREAERDRETRDREPDEQRHVRAIDRAGEDVAAEVVGAEPVDLDRGGRRRCAGVHGERVAGEQRRGQGERHDEASMAPPATIVGLRRTKRRARAPEPAAIRGPGNWGERATAALMPRSINTGSSGRGRCR